MRRALGAVVLALVVMAVATPASALVPHVVIFDPFVPCSIGVGDPPDLPQPGATTSTPLTTSDGETGFQDGCGVADAFFFGAGLSQYFAAEAASTSIFVGKVGVLRGFGAASVATFPAGYGPPFATATNILSASAEGGRGGYFVDVITPPPTVAAPNPGDPTELMLTAVIDVVRTPDGVPGADVDVSFWNAADYTDGATPLDPGFIYTTGGRPVTYDTVVTGLTVGTPVAMQVNLSVAALAQLFASQSQFGSYEVTLDALHTATALLTDTDGNPVTGASGHTYVAVDPLPDLTAPPTTSTTVPTPTTTTTLPGCGGMCGDGVVEAQCGEACDCAPTADPVVGAYGCGGAAIVPAQPDCVVCRGCQLISFCPPDTSTTTSTIVTGSTTSTTTTGSPSTTTTTLAAQPCAGIAGLALAKCEIDAALAQPLCGNEALPPSVDHALRAKLEAASTALGSAATATGRKLRKLTHHATSDVSAVTARAAHAAKAKNPHRHVSATCAATLEQLGSELAHGIAGP